MLWNYESNLMSSALALVFVIIICNSLGPKGLKFLIAKALFLVDKTSFWISSGHTYCLFLPKPTLSEKSLCVFKTRKTKQFLLAFYKKVWGLRANSELRGIFSESVPNFFSPNVAVIFIVFCFLNFILKSLRLNKWNYDPGLFKLYEKLNDFKILFFQNC